MKNIGIISLLPHIFFPIFGLNKESRDHEEYLTAQANATTLSKELKENLKTKTSYI